MVDREAGGQVGGGQNLGDDKNIRWFITWLLCLREFAVLRRWTSRHSRRWIWAVRKLRSSHGCGGLVLRAFFLFWRVCEGSFKLPRLFLSDELPLKEAFLKIWVSEEKSERGHFSGENRNERQPDNLSRIENKDKSKARLSLGLSRIVQVKKHVIWQSLLSPHFMRTETAGWTVGEDKEIQSTGQLDLDLRNNKEDGAEWVLWQSLLRPFSIPGLGQR